MLPLPLEHLFDPNLSAIGRLPARASMPAPKDAAWRMSLDGTWRFQLVPQPDLASEDWFTEATEKAPWRDIHVPGVWTRQETGDYPHYTNWQMPFTCEKPPQVPAANPTGLYRRKISLDQTWLDRHTILHLGGFESLAMVWCNGRFIGMAKDSRLPSEFDLSDALVEGENDLAIMVPRWCEATWIEDQDHWHHGGLHRSVWIESRARTHISNLIVDTDFEPKLHLGSADIRVEVAGPSLGFQVITNLETVQGETIFAGSPVPVEQFETSGSLGTQWKQTYRFDGNAAKTRVELQNARAWSAEHPTRYRLVIELQTGEGQSVECREIWIGFTRIETRERRLRVNGEPIVLIGVNRHDHHHENGKTCSEADIRSDLLTMKRHNINAIRTAHYPNDPALLDIADELGFYVIDEANVECHARWSEVAHYPGYQNAIIERTTRMIARDRNHPCVIGWSLGNEAGHGPAHDAAAAAARHLDPSRFVHYEGAVSLRFSFPFGRSPETTHLAPNQAERTATDLVCPMYAPIDHIVAWSRWAEETKLDDRPLVLCEFSHAMGNSNGSLDTYVDAFFNEAALAGGFVWDWRDQGLAETDARGRFYWAYGGHFGDEPNDGNFNINGLVGPDGTPHPALREYMWAARPIAAELDGDHIRFVNRRAFTSSADLKLNWRLLKDGVEVEYGTLALEIDPGANVTVDRPGNATLDGSATWHLNLEWCLVERTEWAEIGYPVAWDQLLLSDARPAAAAPVGASAVSMQSEDNVGDRDVQIRNGQAIVRLTGVMPCLWRAPTDNDGGKPGARPLFQSKTREWVGYGLNALRPGPLSRTRSAAEDGIIETVEQEWFGADERVLSHRSLWRIRDGIIEIEEQLDIPSEWEDLPRVGIRFELPKRYRHLKWLGMGPDESYPDRCGAQTFGLWSSLVEEQYHPYVRPQEYGAHEQTRWFELVDDEGAGVRITLPQPLSFTARPHHDDALNEAETLAELDPQETTEIHIDVAVRGLGTGACGPDTLEAYRVGPGQYKFTWQLSLIGG